MSGATTQAKPKRRQDPPEVVYSKALSYILRHGASKEGLKMRPDGFIPVQDILRRPKLKGLDLDGLKAIVQNNEKQRFSLSEEPAADGAPVLWIRANQGHSVKVEDLELEKLKADQLQNVIHGTYLKAWPAIEKEGLKIMQRTHIHFAPGLLTEEGVISGMRKSCNVFIYIDAQRAAADGIEFLKSKNGVILTAGKAGVIAPTYFRSVVTKQGEVLMGEPAPAPSTPASGEAAPLASESTTANGEAEPAKAAAVGPL